MQTCFYSFRTGDSKCPPVGRRDIHSRHGTVVVKLYHSGLQQPIFALSDYRALPQGAAFAANYPKQPPFFWGSSSPVRHSAITQHENEPLHARTVRLGHCCTVPGITIPEDGSSPRAKVWHSMFSRIVQSQPTLF